MNTTTSKRETDRDTSPLADAIRAISLALDPDKQGVQWPDPVSWDGRTLRTQMHDLLTLVRSHCPASMTVEQDWNNARTGYVTPTLCVWDEGGIYTVETRW
jgi:hypothetical protein